MNKWKSFTPLAVAGVLGLVAARVASNLVSSAPAPVVELSNLTPIVVASRDLDAGTTLADTDLTTTKMDTAGLPAGAFTSSVQASGKVVRVSVVKGQPVLPSTLADDGAGYGVGATLPAGMRAITVDINDTTGVAGFVLPKSHVDVISTLALDAKQTAKTILEDVLVLAVGTRTNPNAPVDGSPQPAAHTVTLLVKPKDVERLELAATTSRVRLVLRNGRDTSTAESAGVTLADLRGDHSGSAADPFAAPGDAMPVSDKSPATQPTAPASHAWTVQLIKGGQLTSQTFEVAIPPQSTPAPTTAPSDVTVSTEYDPTQN